VRDTHNPATCYKCRAVTGPYRNPRSDWWPWAVIFLIALIVAVYVRP
jgi:hypothetical protein